MRPCRCQIRFSGMLLPSAYMLFLGVALVGLPTVAHGTVWHPAPGTTWQWQMSGTVNTAYDVQMYVVDLFDVPSTVIDQLHADGRVVIGMFRAGVYENWRPDEGDYPPEILGAAVSGWDGELWVDIRNLPALGPILQARMDLAVSKGFDGIVPADVDGWQVTTGFPITYADQITFNQWLADEAHVRDLSVGLHNDLTQIPDLHPRFDWALAEMVYQFGDQDVLLPFVQTGKAVFGVEYEGNPDEYCPVLAGMGYSWLTKDLALGDDPPNACESVTAVRDRPSARPRLEAAVPNPFNPRTVLVLHVPDGGTRLEIVVYDPRGRFIATLAEGRHRAGTHELIWDGRDRDGRDMPSGVYHIRMQSPDAAFSQQSQSIVLVR